MTPVKKIRRIFRGYLYIRHSLPTHIMHWSTAVFSAMLALGRLTQTICGGLVLILKKKIGGTVPDSHLYYGHSLPVSIVHWCNAALLAILLLSGLNIFNAHTALYWGKSSYSGLPPSWKYGAEKTMQEKSSALPEFSATNSVHRPPRCLQKFGGRIDRTWVPILANYT